MIGYLKIMKEHLSLAISFYQRSDKIDKNNTAPVYMRITVNGQRAEIATNKRFDVARWDAGHPVGNKIDAKELQKDLDSMKASVNKTWRDMVDRNEVITAFSIKERFSGHSKKGKTVVEVFNFHNARMRELIGKDYSPATAKRYDTTLEHIKKFIKAEYRKEDLSLWELNYEFAAAWEHYLKTVHQCNHNTAMKYIKNFRKVINLAIKNDWLEKDPFAKFQCNILPVERDFLTKEELSTIEEKVLKMQRMDQIRDIFVFCCYTGLAYADVLKLTPSHIVKGIDGALWIKLHRTKTETKSLVPLLPKALAILEKYRDAPKLVPGTLLPVISNQKMNAYLKELADLCEIDKILTSHMARHTFATTVTLTNGVPIETVSAMLGHKSLRTTQIYSKVVEEKVGNDMAALREKLKGTF
jgi:integrase